MRSCCGRVVGVWGAVGRRKILKVRLKAPSFGPLSLEEAFLNLMRTSLMRMCAFQPLLGRPRLLSASAAPLDHTRLTISKSDHPQPLPDWDSLEFGKAFTDHMLTIPWKQVDRIPYAARATRCLQSVAVRRCVVSSQGEGWGTPKIQPYGPLVLDPAAQVFHYGIG